MKDFFIGKLGPDFFGGACNSVGSSTWSEIGLMTTWSLGKCITTFSFLSAVYKPMCLPLLKLINWQHILISAFVINMNKICFKSVDSLSVSVGHSQVIMTQTLPSLQQQALQQACFSRPSWEPGYARALYLDLKLPHAFFSIEIFGKTDFLGCSRLQRMWFERVLNLDWANSKPAWLSWTFADSP